MTVLPYETVTFLPFYVARAQGMFADENLKIDFLYSLSGGPGGGKKQKVDLALAGDIAFFTSVSTSIEAVLRGWGDVVAVAANATRPFFLLAREEIASVEDLKGKRVMTGGGASRNEMLHLANRMGWTVGHDIILIRGDAVDRQRAFEDPDIDGVAGRTHYLGWAETNGFKPMPYAPGQTWYEGGVAISRRFLEERPDAVRAIVVGLERATAFILDETNRDTCIQTIVDYVKYMDAESAAVAYDAHRPYFSTSLDAAGMQYMASVLAIAKDVPEATWSPRHLDTTFLEHARGY